MEEVTIFGVDLAKNVFQLHGAAADGSGVFRKKLSRPQFARFMAEQSPCLLAMKACASAYRSRWIAVAFVPVGASNLTPSQ
jgi:transposase